MLGPDTHPTRCAVHSVSVACACDASVCLLQNTHARSEQQKMLWRRALRAASYMHGHHCTNRSKKSPSCICTAWCSSRYIKEQYSRQSFQLTGRAARGVGCVPCTFVPAATVIRRTPQLGATLTRKSPACACTQRCAVHHLIKQCAEVPTTAYGKRKPLQHGCAAPAAQLYRVLSMPGAGTSEPLLGSWQPRCPRQWAQAGQSSGCAVSAHYWTPRQAHIPAAHPRP